ncbi:hypothetical protein P5V15_010189 [Pogonomyrmex californicus]
MPNKSRNSEHMRGKWSQDQLTAALEVIQKGISKRQASIENNIPRKTLERRFKSGNNEERILRHIKIMQKHSFSFTRDDFRTLAYNFTNQLKIKHRFNNDTEKADMTSFIHFYLDILIFVIVRKSKSLSLARSLYLTLKRQNDEIVHLTSSENIKKLKLKNAPKTTIKKTVRKPSKET